MALDALEASMASIKESILNGEEVTLRGFGTFGLKERKEKVARNMAHLQNPVYASSLI